MQEIKNVINLMNLVDIYRTFHIETKKIYFLLNTSYNFKIDYILIQKASLNICKKIEITPCIPSDYHRQNKTGYKQQKKKNKKLANSSKLNNLQLKRQKFKNLDLCENKISAYLDLQDT